MRVCYHRSKIEEAWSGVTPVSDFARWRELTAQLELTCEYRTPNTREDLQNDKQQIKAAIFFISKARNDLCGGPFDGQKFIRESNEILKKLQPLI